MKSFQLSADACLLSEAYPAPETLRQVASRLAYQEVEGTGRQWLTEGVPFAFRGCPLLYEALRSWYARELSLDAKDVTLVGSGRLGYSLSPKAFGRPFGPRSDLDLAVVSQSLFATLTDEFNAWLGRYQSGEARPTNPSESFYWSENATWVPHNLAAGFVDSYKIPLRQSYPTARKVEDANSRLFLKLKVTTQAPSIKRVTLRVYRRWSVLTGRLGSTLRAIASGASGVA